MGFSSRALRGLSVALLYLMFLVALVLTGHCGARLFARRSEGLRDQAAAEFEARGYRRASGRKIEVSSPVEAPTVFIGDLVILRAGAEADTAILSRAAEVYGHVAGDLHFRGWVLTVHANAVIEGHLDVDTQILDLRGQVLGDLAGHWQILEQDPSSNAPTLP